MQLSAIEYRLLVEHSPVMIWRADRSKLCDYFNTVWLDFTGRSMEQELGNGWAEGVHPEDFDRCLEIYVSSFDLRLPFEMEYRLKRYDGAYRWIFDRGVPYTDDRGEFMGYIGSCVDVHERVSLERERKQEIEALRGMLSMCSSCKRVRTADGRWEGIESYMRERSRTDVTPTICPQCVSTMMPLER